MKIKRLWLFRVVAIAAGMLPIVLAEVGLRLLNLPRLSAALDPIVDLHNLRPLFELDRATGQYRISQERMNLFRPASFDAVKGSGTFRVFCLGGSTTQGEPYGTETAFGQWLKLNLQALDPDRKFEVVNCGGLSYASYRVRTILQEVLRYDPDLVVLYTGQNEFLERRSYARWRDVPLAVARARGWLGDLQLVKFGRWLVKGTAVRVDSAGESRTEMSREVEALLDYAGGLEEYKRDDSWRAPVIEHFRWNVDQMVDECLAARVPLILMRPVVNLLDCPPMKYEIDPKLSPTDRAKFEARWATAQDSTADPGHVQRALEDALKIDPGHAGAWYYLGRIQWERGDWETARKSLDMAKEHDVCPLRALAAIQNAVSEIAALRKIPLVDAERIFQDRSQHGVVGQRWLIDHIHPNIEGHQLLGETLCDACIDEGWISVKNSAWKQDRKDLYRKHLSSIDEVYFHRGQQRLEGLLLWTQGRAKKVRGQK